MIGTFLLVGGVLVIKEDSPYTGKILFFTGSVISDDLTHHNNLTAKFEENLVSDSIDIFVSERSQVEFTVKGDSKVDVQKDIDVIIKNYSQEIQKQSSKQKEIITEYVTSLEERGAVLEDTITIYKDKFDTNSEELSPISELLIQSEKELTTTNERAYKLKNDLVFFEEPKLLSQQVSKTNNYLKEIVAIGIVIGLILTIAFLVLLKYLEEARASFNKSVK